MSFCEQQRVLFKLLFDQELQQAFIADKKKALAGFDLTAQEQQDFMTVRTDALLMDASMRRQLILSQFAKLMPLSFSLISSIENGIALLNEAINVQVMSEAAEKRVLTYAAQIKQAIAHHSIAVFATEQERQAFENILALEVAMLTSAAELRQKQLAGLYVEITPEFYEEEDALWQNTRLDLAPFVAANVINQPYMHLKQKLCPKQGSALWRHLQVNPLPGFLREDELAVDNGRLLVSRATVTHASDIDPVIDHITVELGLGFAPMFSYIDGTMTVTQMLQQLLHAGAPDALCDSVKSGFYQLLQCGMLVLNNE